MEKVQIIWVNCPLSHLSVGALVAWGIFGLTYALLGG